MTPIPPAPSPPPPAPSRFGRSGFAGRLGSTLGLWVLVAVVVVVGHPLGFAALISLLVLAATREFHAMVAGAGVARTTAPGMVAAGGYTALLFGALWAGASRETLHLLDVGFFALLMIAFFAIQMGRPVREHRALLVLGALWGGFAYLVFGFHFTTRIVFFDWDPAVAGMPPGAWLALWLVAVTKFSDMGAYLTGTALGRHKMIPHISPAKTWEGLGGAFVFALLAGALIPLLRPDVFAELGGLWTRVGLAALLTMFAVFGDLAGSLIKRSLAAKDSGRSLPGIGGALDLVDSICFTAPVLYLFLVFTS